MKPITKQFSEKAAFTIVELLTVMTIIVILIGVLVPSLNMAKRFSSDVRQKAQFNSIGTALELFSNDWDDYPPSDAQDEDGASYCGAMKLCEALVGQDLVGFHPNSRFRRACQDGASPANIIYGTPNNSFVPGPANLKLRKTYLELERVNVYRLQHLYEATGLGNFSADNGPGLFVLCDVYNSVKHIDTGEQIGMPILYYKADKLNTSHDVNTPANPDNIYNYLDNDELVFLGPPPHQSGGPQPHPLNGATTNFYEITQDKKITNVSRPYRPDSYILISAGFDGIYGTNDDITNF